MEWWVFFRRVRKVVFAVAAISSLVWTILLSVYLAREWDHFFALQRGIIFGMIGVNGLSSVMLYLMIVVVFRFWADLSRMIFLLAIHLGSTVPYTHSTSSFSCAIFSSRSFCDEANMFILANAWIIIGLFLCYTAFLLAVYRVPRPVPNTGLDLLSTSKRMSRTSDKSPSSASATELLQDDVEQNARPKSPDSIYSQVSVISPRASALSTVPRAMDPPSTSRLPRPVGSYGAMGRPRPMPDTHVFPPRVSSLSSTGTLSPAPSYMSQYSYRPPSRLFRQESVILNPVQTRRRASLRPLLLNTFVEPSRHGTPDTALTSSTYRNSAESEGESPYTKWLSFSSSSTGSKHTRCLSEPEPSPLPTYYSVPFQLQPGISPIARTGTISLYPHSAPPSIYYDGLYSAPAGSAAILLDVPLRSQTATPGSHSIHSLTPSLHYAEQCVVAKPPCSAHVRAASDPLPSPYGSNLSSLDHESMADLLLPNPHEAMVARGIRRYSSLVSQHTLQSSRGATPTTATRTLADPEWRQLVMSAALGA
ncbi:hypothetical protein BKA93DRAFT_227748 [Sparassis latifolia]